MCPGSSDGVAQSSADHLIRCSSKHLQLLTLALSSFSPSECHGRSLDTFTELDKMSEGKLTPVVSAQQQGPPPPGAASSEQWLRGHLNHFTPAETTAFEEFKKLCQEKGLYAPATADKKASHDDGTLV